MILRKKHSLLIFRLEHSPHLPSSMVNAECMNFMQGSIHTYLYTADCLRHGSYFWSIKDADSDRLSVLI